MGVLGSTTVIDAQCGRKVSNALTMTFKVSADEVLGVATQAGGLGVLLGFKNGGPGRYNFESTAGSLVVDCKEERTTVTSSDAGGAGDALGSIEAAGDEGRAAVLDAAGSHVATLVGHPDAERQEPVWRYPLLAPDGAGLGTLSLVRQRSNLAGEIVDAWLYWDHAGGSLKVPTAGARLELAHPVDAVLGDLLLAACIDLALGPRSFTRT